MLWEPNNKFHKNSSNLVLKSSNLVLNKYNCRYCEKSYEKVKTRWVHEQK